MKKYSFWVKCLTFVLCVVLLLCVAVSGLGVLLAAGSGMYNFSSFSAWLNDNYYDIAETIAHNVVRAYTADQSDSPQWLLEQYGFGQTDEDIGAWFDLSGNDWYYIITDTTDKVLYSTQTPNVEEPVLFGFENLEVSYPVVVGRAERELPNTTTTEVTDTTVEATWPAQEAAKIAAGYTDIAWDPYNGEEVYIRDENTGSYNVTVGISKNYVGYRLYSGLPNSFWQWLFAARMPLIVLIVVSFCLFTAAFVFMMIIAGKSPKTGEANPKALNRLPLDLYLAAGVLGTIGGAFAVYELLDLLFYENSGYNVLFILLICGCGVAVATLDMGFFTALAAQFKVPGSFLLLNSLCGRLLKLGWRIFKKVWHYVVKGFQRVGGYIRDVFALLPVIWKWIAAGGVLGFVLILICASTTSHWYSVFPMFVWCLVFAALVIYCGYSYGVIYKGIQRMKLGDLNEKIKTDWLFGSFKPIAEDLNDLSDVVSVAAEKQMKAERMKTELITNVSHDIKTPLTSVINYVDLLQQPHTQEEGAQYLEVLSRQSARLKKLVEDLMDMSKASSGNMAVEITSLDAVEAVNQALGEFADKLEASKLIPVFRTPDSQLHMQADGKLTWRVLSNLLGNVVKYALPGTRVYIDLLRLDKSVVLSIKNISREELNISAEELTERFVRGDTSRNTDGSGLGLNIAQSLMRLQRGNMDLTVDGDLFKVTLTFPTE